MDAEWDAAFNLTTSYRRDSDIPRPFGDANTMLRLVRYKNGTKTMTDEDHLNMILSRKNKPGTKYASWVVSNCNKTGGARERWDYVQDLVQAGLKLDGYGECWNNTLTEKPWMSDPEKPGLMSQYKFYLAFENSIHCNDYVSEKFWRNSLLQGSVPIVFGPHRSDVEAMAPKKSFIHSEDFRFTSLLFSYKHYGL